MASGPYTHAYTHTHTHTHTHTLTDESDYKKPGAPHGAPGLKRENSYIQTHAAIRNKY